MLRIDNTTGLIREAAYHASPNCDERPDDCAPELLIVHSISLPPGEYGGPHIIDFFQNRLAVDAHPYFEEIQALRVSAHVLIGRNGELVQFVPLHWRAWHAGESQFDGRTRCNDFSIGIELEGTDHTPFRTIQYWKLALLVDAIRHAYPSMHQCPVVGHSDVAPGRKTDPGVEFEWSRLQRLLNTLGGHAL
ncbi:MAG: 1,6-anhydro-N-acetylmuramyl-L-alanine amidase AmpD [Pseudomonadota bacterium]